MTVRWSSLMEALIHKFSCEADKCFWLQGKFSEGVMDRVGRLEKAAGIFDFPLFAYFSKICCPCKIQSG